MNLLVDTHVLIWLLNDASDLTETHYEYLEAPANKILISSISIFEIQTKQRIGKLKIPTRYSTNIIRIFNDFDFESLDLKPVHADLAGRLQGLHKDPFDRLLAAQSIVEQIPIMTIDARLRDLGATVLW